MATYDIVKVYKPYKKEKNRDSYSKSRSLHNILDEYNSSMVCVGYANLLNALFNELDINSISMGLIADTNNREESGHQRLIVYLNDEKYNINGYYLCDPTWDNNSKYLYVHSSFDFKNNITREESVETESLMFNISNRDDFDKNIATLIKEFGLRMTCLNILMKLKYLNPNIYNYFNNKYSFKTDEEYNAFLEEYYNHIISLSNKGVDYNNMIMGALSYTKKLNPDSDIDYQDLSKKIIHDNNYMLYLINKRKEQLKEENVSISR